MLRIGTLQDRLLRHLNLPSHDGIRQDPIEGHHRPLVARGGVHHIKNSPLLGKGVVRLIGILITVAVRIIDVKVCIDVMLCHVLFVYVSIVCIYLYIYIYIYIYILFLFVSCACVFI